MRRDFSADGPDEARLADIAYVRTHQGWLHLAVVMDIWSRRIVGWSMPARMTAEPEPPSPEVVEGAGLIVLAAIEEKRRAA